MHFGKVIWKRVEPWQIGTAGLIESFDLRQLNLVILTAAHTDISEWIISHEIMSTFPTAPFLTWQGARSAFHYNPNEFFSLSERRRRRKRRRGKYVWGWLFGITTKSNLLQHASPSSSKKDTFVVILLATVETMCIQGGSSDCFLFAFLHWIVLCEVGRVAKGEDFDFAYKCLHLLYI